MESIEKRDETGKKGRENEWPSQKLKKTNIQVDIPIRESNRIESISKWVSRVESSRVESSRVESIEKRDETGNKGREIEWPSQKSKKVNIQGDRPIRKLSVVDT